MTYDPVPDASRNPPIAGTSATWPLLIANDAACFELYNPGLEVGLNAAATGLARLYRFRWWGNADGADINLALNIEAYVEAFGTGPGDGMAVAATGPIQTYSQAFIPTTAGWYGGSVYTGGGFPTTEVQLIVPAPGAGSFSVGAIRARLDLSAPVAGTLYPSGFRRIGALWGASGYPVPSEIQSRLRTNPICIARDRPVCIGAHIADCLKTVSDKSPDVWGIEDQDYYSLAGRLLVRADGPERLYRVDAYTNEGTPGTATYSVRVGSGDAQTWSGPGWHSWQVRLGAGRHAVDAMILPGAGNGAAIRSLLVWRTGQ